METNKKTIEQIDMSETELDSTISQAILLLNYKIMVAIFKAKTTHNKFEIWNIINEADNEIDNEINKLIKDMGAQ